MDQGVIFKVLVEVGAFVVAFGVGGEPTAGFWVVEAASEGDETVCGPFGLVAPRVLGGGRFGVDGFFAKGGCSGRFRGERLGRLGGR